MPYPNIVSPLTTFLNSRAASPMTGFADLSALYNPKAYGSIPQIPATSTNRQISDLYNWNTGQQTGMTETTGRTTGGSSMRGGSSTRGTTTTSRDSTQTSSWTPNIPGYEGLAALASGDVASWLRGELDPQAIADAGTWAAQRGIMSGVGMGSPNAAAAYQHFLGLSRLSMQEKGLQGYLQLLAQSPRTTVQEAHEVATQVADSVTDQWSDSKTWQDTYQKTFQNVLNTSTGGQRGTVQNIQDNNIMQAMYAAAPDPYAAAMANLAAQQMGIGAGRGAVGAIPQTAGIGAVSFPRAGAAAPLASAYGTPATITPGAGASPYAPTQGYMNSLYSNLPGMQQFNTPAANPWDRYSNFGSGLVEDYMSPFSKAGILNTLASNPVNTYMGSAANAPAWTAPATSGGNTYMGEDLYNWSDEDMDAYIADVLGE